MFVPSLPSRGAWIEIPRLYWMSKFCCVAPLAGSVDRNVAAGVMLPVISVAPLAGSVDRNVDNGGVLLPTHVAPLAGSVDRNFPQTVNELFFCSRSPRGERG